MKAFAPSFGDVDFNIETAPSSNMKFIVAGAGGLVVLVAILGWMFMGGSSNATQKAEVPAPQTSQQVQAPVSTFSDANTAPASTEQTPQITESVTVDGHNETQAAAKKKPTPTPAKTPEKKKVTVDDLINDN